MNGHRLFLIFSQDDAERRTVSAGGKQVASAAELATAIPALQDAANRDRYCDAVNYLSRGFQFRPIHDADRYRDRYEKKYRAEDPDAPFQEGVPQLRDFGYFDLTEIQPPRLENGSVIFYVEDDFLGIPYRVTAPAPGHPDGDALYDILPMSELPEPPGTPAPQEVSASDSARESPAAPSPPPPPPPPTPLELLHAAVTAQDEVAVQRHLATLGIDNAVCERILTAWQGLVATGAPKAQRKASMLELVAAIRMIKGAKTVSDEMWRLQMSLIKYS